jgi:glucose uptake protein
MILPASHITAFILLIFGMLCWGLWANTFKATGPKWRFELFYFDFAIGVVIASVVLALTAGSLGFDGFSFLDDLRLAGKRQELFGFLAGGVFNLGNMLMLAAVSLAGMSVAFPLAMGFGLIIAGFWNFALNPGGSATFLAVGAIVLLGAVVLGARAAKAATAAEPAEAAAAGSGTRVKTKPKKKSTAKVIFLSLAGGLFLGSFPPLIQLGRAGDNGLGPYSMGFVFALGILFSTFVFSLFFMNLPVQGEPVDIAEFLRAKFHLHVLGFLGGIVWYFGMLSVLIVNRLEPPAAVQPSFSFGLPQAGIVVAALCGLLLWREFAASDASVKIRVALMLFLIAVGIGLSAVALAPTP